MHIVLTYVIQKHNHVQLHGMDGEDVVLLVEEELNLELELKHVKMVMEQVMYVVRQPFQEAKHVTHKDAVHQHMYPVMVTGEDVVLLVEEEHNQELFTINQIIITKTVDQVQKLEAVTHNHVVHQQVEDLDVVQDGQDMNVELVLTG